MPSPKPVPNSFKAKGKEYQKGKQGGANEMFFDLQKKKYRLRTSIKQGTLKEQHTTDPASPLNRVG